MEMLRDALLIASIQLGLRVRHVAGTGCRCSHRDQSYDLNDIYGFVRINTRTK